MKITIHRGANQIGGCITEIATENAKIFIDFGSNLLGSKKNELSPKKIADLTSEADAIFYTHYHGDHVGLHHLIPENVKQYMGAGAIEVMQCKYQTLSKYQDMRAELAATERMIPFKPTDCININNELLVTPYFVSHSAFDAYMFVVEDKKTKTKILHTGDFHSHGYLGKGLFPVLNKFVGNVDILITEGTMLAREQEEVITESQIMQKTIEILKAHKYVFALCSSTDIDRLASFHVACKETKRVFFVDEYQNNVLQVFTKYAGTKTNLYNFDTTFQLINFAAEKVKNKLTKKGFLMPIRSSSEKLIKAMMNVYNDEQPWLIYSMWSGYTEENKEYTNQDIINIRKLFGTRIYDGVKCQVHTSGHADVKTLYELCKAVNPSIGVIPIHKDANTNYVAEGYRVFTEGDTKVGDRIIHIE
ncbi:MAG: MBL fold metallo-hydrolase [Bacteroidales bacterium]|nr:MBL fold metallo-hydrolase [Bacteroidales bacterium]